MLQEGPFLAHLWGSWGERSLVRQCRLIWGSLSTSKAKQPGGRAAGYSGHADATPRDPGGESGSPGSGLPLPWTNTDGVVGHLRSSCKSFHPREAHFRGMCLLLHPRRSPRRALGGWAQARIARHQRFVVFSAAASLCSSLPRTAAGRHCGKIRTGSTLAHTQFSVTIQTCPKTVSNRPILQAGGLKIRLRYFWPTSTRNDGRG